MPPPCRYLCLFTELWQFHDYVWILKANLIMIYVHKGLKSKQNLGLVFTEFLGTFSPYFSLLDVVFSLGCLRWVTFS